MKKFLTRAMLLLLVLSMSILPAYAAEEETEGLTFGDNYRYEVAYSQIPNSMSAWIRIQKNMNYTVALFGNYTLSSFGFVNFEIQYTGAPKINYIGTDGEEHPAVFDQVDVRTGEWLHLALVHDTKAGEARCYVNGELRQTVEGAVAYGAKTLIYPFYLGGDFRPANYRFFQGEVKKATIYSTARTSEQILADYRGEVQPDDASLIAMYEVSAADRGKDIKDLSTKGNDLECITVWLEEGREIAESAYTFAVLGDTQSLLYNYPTKFSKIYDWLLKNKDEKKIAYVFGLGDITDKNSSEEWVVAKQQISRLNGVIPHSHIRGNHDGVAEYKAYMNVEGYTSQFNGFYAEGDWTNSWRTFEVAGDRYLMLTLDFQPSDDLLAWACDIVEAHPDRKVIITTHAYLGSENEVSVNKIWNKLGSKYENIFLIMNGHFGKNENIVWRQDEGIRGNTVTQILIDPQEIDKYAEDAVGLVALLHFYEDGSRIEVEYYSTVQKAYYKAENQFTIWLTDEPPTDPGEDSSEEESSTDEGNTTELGTTVDPSVENGGTSASDDKTDESPRGCAAVASVGLGSLVLMLGAALVATKKKRI